MGDPTPRRRSPRTRRLGVIGGTFDPPHYGHLVLAENGRAQLELDTVLFVPAARPPHKPERPISETRHRVALVEAAIAGNPAFQLSRVDLDRPGPNFTVDMLGTLHATYPEATLFFLMGGDSLAEFLSWRDPAGIVAQAHLAVMQRPGWEADVETLEEHLPRIGERLAWLDTPHLDISGTELRRRVREGLPIRYLVPPTVRRYVREHGLYRAGAGSKE
jgi:nicotinate-nucleotide adenylyltransferase